ncbi:hypothetical protein COV22_00150, partial [Candidatus Woesearchaeota archaeon CG10_big_fil_rev_8_21_14_0_10_47_5]
DEVLMHNVNVVVVDDNSPDGTWRLVQDIASRDRRVNLLLRKKDKGRGRAGRDGFKYCLNKGADIVIEMDGDFSHHPKYIPLMLKEIKNADVVLGSRVVAGGVDARPSIARRIITKGANAYLRLLLGLRVGDCNSGYRCFRREVLEEIGVNNIESVGPSIVQEVLFKASLKGFKISEVPIVFKDRELGSSKLGAKHLASGYFMALKFAAMHKLGRLK